MEYALRLIQNFINFFIAFYFLKTFFSKRKCSIGPDIIIIGAFAVMLSFVNSVGIASLNTIGSTIFISVLMLLLFKFKSRIQALKLVFSGIILNAIIICCEFILFVIVSAAQTANTYVVINKAVENAAFSFISTTIFFIFTIISKFVLSKRRNSKSNNDLLNLALLPLPILSIAVAYFIVTVSHLNGFDTEMSVFGICLVLCLLVVNIVVFTSDSDSQKKYIYRAQIKEMRLQSEMKETLIKQQETNIRETNALVHDFQHQLRTLNVLVQEECSQNNNLKSSKYIADALQNLPSIDMYTNVKSDALRCILINTHNECRRLGICFDANIESCDLNFISYQDICTIFSNSLDNAIRACSELRESSKPASISLNVRSMNCFIAITIANDKMNLIIEKDGKIQTTKSDENHGFGLINIRHAAEKYGGSLTKSFNENNFEISILLQKNIKSISSTRKTPFPT